ncbi:MAG: phage tail protein [Planctomycetota bacterium]
MSTYSADEMLVVLGFTVTIDGGGTGTDVDSAWETCSGGALQIEVADASVGTDPYHETTPGHKYVDTLTLRGPLTSGRVAMCDWITKTLNGEEWKRTVTVSEILKDGAAGKTFAYEDCYPTRYVYPAFSASGTGNLYEEINIKPIRLTLS